MRKVKILIIILIFILILCCFVTQSFAKYFDIIFGRVSAELKNSIFVVEKPETIQGQISSLNNNYYEFCFNILNYISSDNIQKISEVEFEYTIKLIPSTDNFPAKYRLINLFTNQEINLNSDLETEKINLGTSLENHNYKLIVQWDMENTNQNFDENFEIEILVNGVQKI